jgi:hypothetical protein
MRVRRPCQSPTDRAEIEAQGSGVARLAKIGCPQSLRLGIGFDQGDLLRRASRQAQECQRGVIDIEHGGCRSELRGHVGDRGAVGQRKRARATAEEFEDGPDDALAPQELGDCQHEVGGLDPGLPRPR